MQLLAYLLAIVFVAPDFLRCHDLDGLDHFIDLHSAGPLERPSLVVVRHQQSHVEVKRCRLGNEDLSFS
jgi:hypothetical protein